MEKTDPPINLTEIAKRNPKVDIELLKRAQEEMKRLGVTPATYNIQGAFTRRTPRH